MSKFTEILEDYAAIAAFIEDKEAELADVKKAKENIKAALMAEMNSVGITNARSLAGHAICLVTSNSARVVDGEAWFDFVFERGDAAFLTKHCAADAVAEYLKENNQLPPGVQYVSAQSLRFTKAK